MSILLYRTSQGVLASIDGVDHRVNIGTDAASFDDLLNRPRLAAELRSLSGTEAVQPVSGRTLLAPVGSQEIWASGVTYFRSRTARMEESKDAGGGTFYDRVYEAERPELFFKATAARVVAPGGRMRLRRDSRWMVPEPELVLVINNRKEIIGYTAGNDLSCRDIEGENPLYLPQAKVFDGCAALGPGILIAEAEPLSRQTAIKLEIARGGRIVSAGQTQVSELKRSFAELVEFLTRELSFSAGVFLFTGTGIVPPDDFTLQADDEIRISIDGIGTLVNSVG